VCGTFPVNGAAKPLRRKPQRCLSWPGRHHGAALALTPPPADPTPPPRAVEPLVQEIVLLIQRSEEYNTFMTGKMRHAIMEHFTQQAQAQAPPPPGGDKAGGGGAHHQQAAATAAATAADHPAGGGALGRRASLAGPGAGLSPELAAQAAAAVQAAEAKYRWAAWAKYRWAAWATLGPGSSPAPLPDGRPPRPSPRAHKGAAPRWKGGAAPPARQHPRTQRRPRAPYAPPAPGVAPSTSRCGSWWRTTWRWRSSTWTAARPWPSGSTNWWARQAGGRARGLARARAGG
jgi:hypothetical protein